MDDNWTYDNRELSDGDRVIINVGRIREQPDFDKLSKLYIEFLKENEGRVFTAKPIRKELVVLKEAPEWLFWEGNLLRVVEEEA